MIGNYFTVTKSKKINRRAANIESPLFLYASFVSKRCDTDQRSIATEQCHHNKLVVQSTHPPSISQRLRTFQTNS